MANILNTTHNLFATEDVSITKLWATSSLVLAGPASASVMLVAAEQAGRSPWFMVKSDLTQFVRNLEPTAMEREFRSPSLTFCDPMNTMRFCVEKIIYEILFNSPGLYWCFKYLVASQDNHDWHRGFGLDSQTLMHAFLEFSIPGEVPSGMRGPWTLRSNSTPATRAASPYPMVVDEENSSDDRESTTMSIGSGGTYDSEGPRQNSEGLYIDEYPESDVMSVLSVDVKTEPIEPSLHDSDLLVESSTVVAPVPTSFFPSNMMGFLTRFSMDLQRASLPPQNDSPDISSQPQHPMKREGSWPESSDPKRRRLF